MFQYILFVTVVVLTIGMGSVPPISECKYDPALSRIVSENILSGCKSDCSSREVVNSNCVSDCVTFMKWGYKYSEEK